MSQALSFATLFLLFGVFLRTDALYGHIIARCQFSSPDGHDAVFLNQFYCNKVLKGQFNSTLKKVVGYTKGAKEFADALNRDKILINEEIRKAEGCRIIPQRVHGLLNPVEPYVKLRSVKAVSSKHPGMLICSMYNFYPKQIIVTWLRNGKTVTSDVTSTEEQPNGNWLYQIHSYLEYTPTPGEKITCMVEHASLREPKLYEWEPRSDSGTIKFAVGIAGLLLGLVSTASGLIYYKKYAARLLVPTTTEVFDPEPL